MNELKIETLYIGDLTPYEKNSKLHPTEQIEQIKKSIERYGMNDPIGVWKDAKGRNIIVEGHGRYLACKELGIDMVPVIRLNHMSETEMREYLIVHNKTTMNSDFNYDVLFEELKELNEIDAEWDAAFFDFNLTPEAEEDPVDDNFNIDEAIHTEPISKRGQVYKLGEHRLMVGDSTSETDVDKLMDGELADLVVTDPPYNVAIENSQGMTIENDNMSSAAFKEFLTKAANNIKNYLKPGGAFYVWFASREHVNFETALNDAGLQVRQELIWNKNSMILGRQDYQWKHEPCLYGWNDGASHYFIDDRTQTTIIEDQKQDFKKMKKEELVELLEKIYSDKESTTIINENKPAKNDLHPTMKPIPLIARQVKNSSKIGEKVLDLFGGSGSTLITCEQLKRKCYMMEYDPVYADVIIQRWEKLTGKTAVLLTE